MKILTLFFTYGTSLKDWENNGTLDREINVYKKFLNYFDKIYFITYGKNDKNLQYKLPKNIHILPKKYPLPNSIYSFLIPFAYWKELRESSWLKTNQMLGSWSAVIAKFMCKKKLALRSGYTESLSFIGRGFFRKKITELLELISYKSSDFSIVTSEHQKEYLSKKYGIKNIHIIPNGIDIDIFKPLEKNSVAGKIKLLFVGRLNPEKNIINLLEAIKSIENISLKIVGQGKLEKNILQFKEKNGIDLEIIHKIPNSGLPRTYNDADIYIQPSIYEGNPKTILEAMACGLPVIASNIDGITNIISHKKTGFLCETGSESIESAVLDMTKDESLTKELGKNARVFVENNYALNKSLANEIKIYRTC